MKKWAEATGKFPHQVETTGCPKKMSHSILKLKSVVEDRFYFSTCVSESEFQARSI